MFLNIHVIFTINCIFEKSIVSEYLCDVHLESQLFCGISHAIQTVWCSYCSSVLPYRTHDCRSGWSVYPIFVCLTFFWLHFLSRTVRKCNKQVVVSKIEDSEIVLLEWLRTTRKTPHYPTASSPSIFLNVL